MVQMTFPNGTVIDFEDASDSDIEGAIGVLSTEQPELFEETKPLDLGTASLEEIRSRMGLDESGKTNITEYQPSNPGEIEDAGFQFLYGRADSAGDRAKRLEAEFGPDSYQQVEGTEDFVLLLDNVSPEKKQEYGLPETGDMYVNEPGMSWYDVAGFAGAEVAPMTAALGAGLMFSGVGLIPGMILMAGAGGAGKAFDELVIEDRFEKMNTQSDDAVWGDIGMTAAFYGVGEGLGRGLFAVGRRLLKGPGPRPDPARIEELVLAGMGRAAATRAAREESKTELRRAVAEGARPTVSEVSQKAILGRMQSIYEGIFPNAGAAAQNFNFVKGTLDDLASGAIDDATAKALLTQQSEAISNQVANAMKNANVDEAARLANQHMQKVIDNEFKVLLDMYNPNQPLTTGWRDTANLAARLFEQDSNILYKKSEDFLAKLVDENGNSVATFSAKPLKDAVEAIQSSPARAAVVGEGFEKGLFKYIKDPDAFRAKNKKLGLDSSGNHFFTMTELMGLRSALRSISKDPSLAPGVEGHAIGKMVKGIDDTINNRLEGLAYLRTTTDAQQKAFPPIWSPAQRENFEKGLEAWKIAQNFHSKGVQRFKSFSEDLLVKNIKSGLTLSDREVVNAVVRNGQPEALLRYLKSVTPSGRAAEGIQAVPQSVFDDAAKAANAGRFKEANQILDNANVSPEIVKRLPAFAEKLGVTDPYGRMVASEFSDTIRSLGRMAEARANPLKFRNRVRDSLAREWLEQNYTTSTVDAGAFSPTVFASRFDQLGKPLQEALFGKTNAKALQELMRDYHKVGMSNKNFATASAEALGATAQQIRTRAMGLTGGRSISDEIANVQSIMREAERQSDDALFQAFAKGKIDDADSLVQSILSRPSNYDRLVRDFGAQLDGPGGVKDMVMARLMEAAFPQGVLPDVVASGAWGAPMRRQISNLNRNGALSKVLGDGDSTKGQVIVNDLIKASKIGERISDQALKGKQGLASAAFAAGAGMRLITNPLAFMGEAVGIFAMGRVMRQKWFLNSLLKPRYDAGLLGLGIVGPKGGRRLLQEARRAGADLEGVSPLGLELRERVAQEARAVAASLQEQQIDSDTRSRMGEAIRENVFQPVQNIQQQLPDIPAVAAQAQQVVNPLRQAMRERMDPRVQAEQALLGGR